MRFVKLFSAGLFLLFLTIMMAGCPSSKNFHYLSYTKNPDEIKEISNRLEKVYYIMLGHFTNKKQADTTSSRIYNEQEIISVPIWRKRKGEYWFYSGRFKANFTSQALTQGIYRLNRKSPDTLALRFYGIPNEEEFEEEWKKETPFKNLEPKDLSYNNDCISYIVRSSESGSFDVIAGEYPCPNNISYQIHYFDFVGVLSLKEQRHFNVFYDENHQEVFRYAKPFGLKFDRLNKEDVALD